MPQKNIVEIIQKEATIGMYPVCKERQFEMMGVNTIEQLQALEKRCFSK